MRKAAGILVVVLAGTGRLRHFIGKAVDGAIRRRPANNHFAAPERAANRSFTMPCTRMKQAPVCAAAALLLVSLFFARTANGQALVKVTPLGSHSGELCAQDRALLFEDPTGVRILYDPGFTTDETDSRLGDVHVILLSHPHPDHIGGSRPIR